MAFHWQFPTRQPNMQGGAVSLNRRCRLFPSGRLADRCASSSWHTIALVPLFKWDHEWSYRHSFVYPASCHQTPPAFRSVQAGSQTWGTHRPAQPMPVVTSLLRASLPPYFESCPVYGSFSWSPLQPESTQPSVPPSLEHLSTIEIFYASSIFPQSFSSVQSPCVSCYRCCTPALISGWPLNLFSKAMKWLSCSRVAKKVKNFVVSCMWWMMGSELRGQRPPALCFPVLQSRFGWLLSQLVGDCQGTQMLRPKEVPVVQAEPKTQ